MEFAVPIAGVKTISVVQCHKPHVLECAARKGCTAAPQCVLMPKTDDACLLVRKVKGHTQNSGVASVQHRPEGLSPKQLRPRTGGQRTATE